MKRISSPSERSTNRSSVQIEIAEEFLYKQLVYDPLWQKGAPPQLAKQIVVLIAALSDTRWTDFRDPTSQVLANYYDTEDVDVEMHFWQQLLLSVELDLRLQAAGAQEQSLISHVPEKVAWDLALSKVWLSKMALIPIDEGFLRPATAFHVTALTKNTQKERLLSFARKMKWVNMENVERMLEEDRDGGIPLEFRNAHTSSWITGTILPGPPACWLAMKCLIDCDLTIINAPPGFDNMESNFGFQYAGSTYWYFESILGKVLGALQGVNQDYGWIGPCIPTSDLFTLQTALIHAEDVPVKPSKRRTQNIAARSAPLGPPAPNYSIRDYTLPVPEPTDAVDSIRIQKLALSPHPLSLSHNDENPITYDAAIVFVVQNQTIPIRLRYNVSFIHCPPCRNGPHPLFWDYAHQSLKPDELLLDLRCWNGVSVDAKTPAESRSGAPPSSFSDSPSSSSPSSSFSSTSSGTMAADEDRTQRRSRVPESILVVEADGVSDNEVLVRAWASHVGFSAVVATKGQTCVACAVRMAFAASVDMVIFGGGGGGKGMKETGVV